MVCLLAIPMHLLEKGRHQTTRYGHNCENTAPRTWSNRAPDMKDFINHIWLYWDTWKVLANRAFAQCSTKKERTKSRNSLSAALTMGPMRLCHLTIFLEMIRWQHCKAKVISGRWLKCRGPVLSHHSSLFHYKMEPILLSHDYASCSACSQSLQCAFPNCCLAYTEF